MKLDGSNADIARDMATLIATYGTGSERLEPELNKRFAAGAANLVAFSASLWEAVDNKSFCTRENGGIRFDRLAKPTDDTHGLSIDLVWMDDCEGPRHRHTTGEVGLVLPRKEGTTFDAKPAGWYVYPPGHEHVPTVRGGECLIMYFLPNGELEFLNDD